MSIGRRRGWISNCANTLVHLLKIQYSSSLDSVPHWRNEVLNFRKNMYDTVRASPGMKGSLDSMVATAWRRARASAVDSLTSHSKQRTSISKKHLRRTWNRLIPVECPYQINEIVGYDPFDKSARPSENCWPEQVEQVLKKLPRAYQSALPTRHGVRVQQALHELSNPITKENSTMPARNEQDHGVAAEWETASENTRLYWKDPWTWACRQSKALRERNFDAVDWESVIEEIEGVVEDARQEWMWNCATAIEYILRIEYGASDQPLWKLWLKVSACRLEMYLTLRQNFGMRVTLSELLRRAWHYGRQSAVQSFALHYAPNDLSKVLLLTSEWDDRLPKDCPYSITDIVGYDPLDRNSEPDDEVCPVPVAQALNKEEEKENLVRTQPSGQSVEEQL